MSRILILFLAYLSVVAAVDIQPDAFYQKLVNNELDLVIDVRTQGEWDLGHIEGATHVESLQNAATLPTKIDGCQGECREIVVYCRSGNRAVGAIRKLVDEFGFQGNISNGLGINQWKAAGYELINGTSVDPPCAASDSAPCNVAAPAGPSLGGEGGQPCPRSNIDPCEEEQTQTPGGGSETEQTQTPGGGSETEPTQPPVGGSETLDDGSSAISLASNSALVQGLGAVVIALIWP